MKHRVYLWEKISRIGVLRKDRWCMLGDFNDILHNEEKIGGPRRSDISFQPFVNMINACEMTELPSQGRLKAVRKALSKWKKKNNTNSSDKIQNLETALEVEQSAQLPNFKRIYWLKRDLVKEYRAEELYWRLRRARKRLEKILDEKGVFQFSEAAKAQVAIDYFNKLFKSSNPASFEAFFSNFAPKVTNDMNAQLCKEVTNEEIEEAVFAIKASSAPGPDGMSVIHGLKNHPQVSKDFIAIKSDMSKAYDRVEWGYLRQLLKALGFSEKWILWVMACVTSVTFSVLINDQPHGMIVPERGLRQGDPLSPFLFVLCAEGLSHLLKQAELEGKVKGVSFGEEGPIISHLLFADDSLFMCKADEDHCNHLKAILRRYEKATGQTINVDKSAITFGKKVDEDLGGLGFKDIELFNQALLAKQAWRLLNFPNSLLARLLKSRYFPHGDFLKAVTGVKPSLGWKSILHGRELVEKGISRRIGDRKSSFVWTDPWMEDEDGSMRAPWRKNYFFDSMLKVKDIINADGNQWNYDKLQELFYPQDIKQILKFPPVKSRSNFWIWKFNKSGDFSVKSAFWLVNQYDKESVLEAKALPSLNPLKQQVWKISSEPKIKNFLWKALSSALPVDEGFSRRGMKAEEFCQICGSFQETINHVLFSCESARQVWALSNIPYPRHGFDSESVFANMKYLLQLIKLEGREYKQRRAIPWLMWNIWIDRNKFLFEGLVPNALGVVQRSLEEAENWFQAQACDTQEEDQQKKMEVARKKGWKCPLPEWKKCNIGFCWSKKEKMVGAAWVLRDERGVVILHSRRLFSQMENLDHAKFSVLSWAIESLAFHRQVKVVFAFYDLSVVEMINNPIRWPAFSHVSSALLAILSTIKE
ncbi:uncharacterized protein LOC106363406 [Brassica napus]|uniref:uncharacterized protein LOC106363406 n=1 Tax=Brassica napus TaxID=3708 RepID=UPI002079EA58|nr:uncharacterized protein LOC106363406 [Brassica napus]